MSKITRYDHKFIDIEQTESEMIEREKGEYIRVEDIAPIIKIVIQPLLREINDYKEFPDTFLNALEALKKLIN